MLNNLPQMHLKLFQKKQFKKMSEATGDLIGNKNGNKIADETTRVSNTLPQNNSETNEEEILREKYISPELRQKFIDDPRLKED